MPRIKKILKNLFNTSLLSAQNRRGQHFVEYTVLVSLVVAGIIITSPYLIRSWHAHVKSYDDSVQDSFNDPLIACTTEDCVEGDPDPVCTAQDPHCGNGTAGNCQRVEIQVDYKCDLLGAKVPDSECERDTRVREVNDPPESACCQTIPYSTEFCGEAGGPCPDEPCGKEEICARTICAVPVELDSALDCLLPENEGKCSISLGCIKERACQFGCKGDLPEAFKTEDPPFCPGDDEIDTYNETISVVDDCTGGDTNREPERMCQVQCKPPFYADGDTGEVFTYCDCRDPFIEKNGTCVCRQGFVEENGECIPTCKQIVTVKKANASCDNATTTVSCPEGMVVLSGGLVAGYDLSTESGIGTCRSGERNLSWVESRKDPNSESWLCGADDYNAQCYAVCGSIQNCAVTGTIAIANQNTIRSSKICAIRPDGRLWCTTGGGYSDSTLMVKDVSTNEYSMCILLSSGNILCQEINAAPAWSEFYKGGDARAIVSGQGFHCIQRGNGSVKCLSANPDAWNADAYNVDLPIQYPLSIDAHSGGDQICALTSDRSVVCGSIWDLSSFVVEYPSSRGNVVQISIGTDHKCVLLDNKTVQCWGENRQCQVKGGPESLGEECVKDAEIEVGIETVYHGAKQINAGFNATCVLDNSGYKIVCWGYNGNAQISGEFPIGNFCGYGVSNIISLVGPFNTYALTTECTRTPASGSCQPAQDLDSPCYCAAHFERVGQSAAHPGCEHFDQDNPIQSFEFSGANGCAIHQNGSVRCWGSAFGSGNMSHPFSIIKPYTTDYLDAYENPFILP